MYLYVVHCTGMTVLLYAITIKYLIEMQKVYRGPL